MLSLRTQKWPDQLLHTAEYFSIGVLSMIDICRWYPQTCLFDLVIADSIMENVVKQCTRKESHKATAGITNYRQRTVGFVVTMMMQNQNPPSPIPHPPSHDQ